MIESKPQTTADAAQIIEQLAKQETDKLRSRLAEKVRFSNANEANRIGLKSEIADLRDCIKLMKDGGAMIAAALFDIDSP